MADGMGIGDRLPRFQPNVAAAGTNSNRIHTLWALGNLGQKRIITCECVITIVKGTRGGVIARLVFTDDSNGHWLLGLAAQRRKSKVLDVRRLNIKENEADGTTIAMPIADSEP